MRPSPEPISARWRRSSCRNADGGARIEIAGDFPGTVPVHDSKTPTAL
ncbi:DUF397 domain-containing protein [Streptomyces pratens]|uniref:DUF397 domain-containing protein n=1 Tax=Streptomyces pratens TaxID=887456 RepID=A0ABW1M361_9ACTN